MNPEQSEEEALITDLRRLRDTHRGSKNTNVLFVTSVVSTLAGLVGDLQRLKKLALFAVALSKERLQEAEYEFEPVYPLSKAPPDGTAIAR